MKIINLLIYNNIEYSNFSKIKFIIKLLKNLNFCFYFLYLFFQLQKSLKVNL